MKRENSKNPTIKKNPTKLLKEIFSFPQNRDFQIRELYIKSLNKYGTLFFLQGMVNSDAIERNIIKPLIEEKLDDPVNDNLDDLIKKVLTVSHAQTIIDDKEMINSVLRGMTILIVDGDMKAVAISTTSFEHRGVDKPQSENVIKGPSEAFIESASVNRSLIRKQVYDANLISEKISVGNRSPSDVSIMYVKNLANPDIVDGVKERIESINTDIVQGLSVLEQYIEERPYSLIPSVLYTERPDRAAAFLSEGHVVLLMENSPSCLIVPVTLWSFFHTAEDTYQRWAFGNFVRLIRFFALFVALLVPSIYIAIANFHFEMLPSDLLLSIAATRAQVPFPAIVEVVIMEIAFELLREAGIRIPSTIGPTIGIVGALILGQAAVEANIISPILVIVVAITGLASFAIPNISFSFTIRIARFLFLLFAATLGFLGIFILFTVCLAYASSFKSFGVPFLAPVSPHFRSSKDLVVRPPVWKQWLRPMHVYPKEEVRGPKVKGGQTE